MAGSGLRQQDLEQLTAWMDGELNEDEAREVIRRVATDSRWRRAYEDFAAVDRALEMVVPPTPPADLASRIVRAANRRRLWRRAGGVAAAAAVAAGVILAVWLGRPAGTPTPTPGDVIIARQLQDVPEADRFMVENLDVFRNYDRAVEYEKVRSIADDETLTALAALEDRGRS